jgi:gliding motility-associated-like protein
MIKSLLCLVLPFFTLVLSAQDYNPFVSGATITPPVLVTGGSGIITFTFGNNGSSNLDIPGTMTITITLSGGVPNTADPLNSIGDAAANRFVWQFSGNTFTGTQSETVQSGYHGNITVDYRANTASTRDNPANGAKITINPGPYSASDKTTDNSTEVFTYTDCTKPSAPDIGTITQPTCITNTGSIELRGLPSQWTVTKYPGGETRTGTTPATIFSGLVPDIYYFTITIDGCISDPSRNVVIEDVPANPKPPVIQNIIQPGCGETTGSVVLGGLPSLGEWTVTTFPGGAVKTGNTTQTTIQDLPPATYYFTVSVNGCTSTRSADAKIDPALVIPPAPAGSITQPSCTIPTGSITFNNLPTGSWTLTIYPGGSTRNGSGAVYTLPSLPPDTYSFTVTTSDGCTSPRSTNFTIREAGNTEAPNIDNITQPSCTEQTGSVHLNRLPSEVTWTLTIYPAVINRTGSGTTYVWTGLAPGSYTFTVTPSGGCTSPASGNAVVEHAPAIPSAPVPGNATPPGCSSTTGSVALSGLPVSGTWTVTVYPDRREVRGTGSSAIITGLVPGTYTFDVTSAEGCRSEQSASIMIPQGADVPAAPGIVGIIQPTCSEPAGRVNLTGLPAGTWVLTRSPGNVITEGSGTTYTAQDLPGGTYTYTVSNSAGCTSEPSGAIRINEPPLIPVVPEQRIDCFLGTGFAIVTVTRPTGFLYEYRLDNGNFSDNRTFFGVSNGQHTITVRSGEGCTTTGQPFNVSCGCVNAPTVMAGNRSGSVCGITPVTVDRNTFGGSATAVTISSNGAGSITPTGVSISPFSFTYTPAAVDLGRTITITLTTNNPLGEPCSAATSTFTLDVNQITSAPVSGTVTQPSCNISTGTVVLNGLPSTGTWMLTRNPGNISITGSGPSFTVTGLESGSYTFTVTANGCISMPGGIISISPQPTVPAAPTSINIVHPTCAIATGSVTLGDLPAGSWSLTRYPGAIVTNGSGSTISIASLPPGTYNFTVSGTGGCTSGSSANIIINAQPVTPAAPQPGNITAPTCPDPRGRAVLTGLPLTGNWTIEVNPGGSRINGSGSTTTISNLSPGTYNFALTNDAGCTSALSGNVVIPAIPDSPVLVIRNPAPVCEPATVNISSPEVVSASSGNLTYTFWLNRDATVPFTTPERAGKGVYYVKVTNAAQCTDIESITVDVKKRPVATAGPDQELDYEFTTSINASEPDMGENGIWSLYSGAGLIAEPDNHSTRVTDLGSGENIFLWTVTNNVCPPSTDTLKIKVKDLTVPSLITPNNDGNNDYFYLRGIEASGPNELIIFDRRGVRVYYDRDYHNNWNGVDYNDRPLPDDTYYYVLNTGKGKPRSGFIVIRR